MGPLQIVFVLLLCLVPIPLSDALAYGWGKNDQAQLGMGHFSVVTTPTSIPYFSRVVLRDALTATNYIIFMADNGTAYGSGLQYYGQFATGIAGAVSTPILCPFLNRSLDIVLPGTSCNANFNTNLLGWGNVAGHVLGRETGLFPRIQIALPAYRFDGKVLSVHSVQDGVIVRLANNTVWAAGNNGGGRLSIGSTTTTYRFVQVNFWRTVSLQQIFSSQSRHACALSTSRSLYCWGSNELGQLGTRDTTTYTSPTLVSFFDENHLEVYKVVFGDVHTIVLTCGGKVYAFGANTFGQLGFTKSTGANSTPRLVNVGNISDVVTGMYQTYARRSDNRWFVWGGIANGGLGLTGINDIATPTEHTFLRNNGINRIRASSQSLNFIGYEDDSVNNDKLSCPVLVDECVRGTHSCHANATCTDLERGHSCSCKEGYIGDGYVTGTGCARDNSCASRQDYCDENAQCFDTANDGPYCICNYGFDGDGTAGNCRDIDECEFAPCGANAECVNTAPMYYCECYPNYFGDPYYEGCVLLCNEGEYAHYNSCISCPPGSYTNSRTATFCTPCPVGSYSSIEGLGSLEGCIPCGTGGYAGLGARYCSLCIHGYTNDPHVPHEDNSTCYPCPLGTYGYYGQCYQCTDGQYSIEPAAKRCNSCPPGHFVSGTSSLQCEKCPAGHKSIGGTAACAVCPTGFYSPAGSTDCFKCPPGTSTNGTAGQESCSKCPVGRFAARSAVPNCFNCAAGYYADEEGTTNCKRCPSGTFSNPGSSECTPCEAGMYAANSAPTKCLKCESGSKSSPDGTSCIPCNTGEYFSSTTKDCDLCSPGTFSNVVGSSSCTKCSAGTYTSTYGATICKQCPVNTYSNTATGFASCASCPAGKTSSGGASSCS